MKLNIIFLFVIVLAAATSCNKNNDFNYPKGKVGISTIVYFPSISTNGSRLSIIYAGHSFTDMGATATLGTDSATYTTSGTVNTAMPGLYNITYTASNPQGNMVSDFRTVVVIGADVAANNFSGTYVRTSNGQTSTWTLDPDYPYGVYNVVNAGGASVGAGDSVIAVNYTGTQISIPQQISPTYGGMVSSSNETYTIGTPNTYSWIFHAGGYGTSLRTFTKQ